MPRKLLTIKDFKFTLENTKTIQTSLRMKNTKLSIISVNFTCETLKNYRQIVLHTLNLDKMIEFINKLNNILEFLKITPIIVDNIVIKKCKTKESNYYTESYWGEMPEFKYNSNFTESTTVLLEVETINKPEYMSFINLFYEKFNVILWPKLKSLWYPNRPIEKLSEITDKMFLSTENITNKYPIYIISKGRYDKRYTSNYLEWCGIDYKIVIEPSEYENYLKHISSSKILILPEEYLNKNQGGIPARNFVWKHAKESGSKYHWILDDNIASYKRYYNSQKIIVKSGLVFRVIEDYIDRFQNVKMAGHNYTMFAISTDLKSKPVTFNTRIYSSILLANDIFPEFQWRGKYNEDTDLSLRILKAKYSTILFNCFLADKLRTMKLKGGNTDTIYSEENAMFLKADSLVKQHPDVAKIITRFGRQHHYVNYTGFKNNELIPINGLHIKNEHNNYGMYLDKKNVDDLYINFNDEESNINNDDVNEDDNNEENEENNDNNDTICDNINAKSHIDENKKCNESSVEDIINELKKIKESIIKLENMINSLNVLKI